MLINNDHGLLAKFSGFSGTILEALMVMSFGFVGYPELLLTISFISIDFAEGHISYVVFMCVSVACRVLVNRYRACSKRGKFFFRIGRFWVLYGRHILWNVLTKFWCLQIQRHDGFTFYTGRILSFIRILVQVHLRIHLWRWILLPIIILQFIKSTLDFCHLFVQFRWGRWYIPRLKIWDCRILLVAGLPKFVTRYGIKNHLFLICVGVICCRLLFWYIIRNRHRAIGLESLLRVAGNTSMKYWLRP